MVAMTNRSRLPRSRPALLLLAGLALFLLAGCSSPLTGQPAAQGQASPAGASVQDQPAQAARATRTPSDGLPTIALAKLPPEARTTVQLIEQGGPFPYRQDGATFQNREGHLPKRPAGYYKEYTVITPGSPDRGARRIIAGQGGELYYTDDHYDTFKRVIP